MARRRDRQPQERPPAADATPVRPPAADAASGAAASPPSETGAETGAARDAGAAPARPAPGLHLVATPIGNARDITLRALDLLAGCDAIAAEDTRVTLRLMEIHGIARAGRPLVAYHDRSGGAAREKVLAHLAAGRSVAYCSDAGTPLVADPGFRLVGAALEAGHAVHALPGPSAALAALSVSGLPTDRFLFAGFPPPKAAQRRRWLGEIAGIGATLVLYESPHRVVESVADMARVLGGARPAVLARELTKRFETVRRMSLEALAGALAEEGAPRGEIVLVVAPPAPEQAPDMAAVDAALEARPAGESLRDAASAVAAALGLPRRRVYARALERARALDEN